MIFITFQGSKVKYSKYICPILQKFIDDNKIKTYIEPFVGGANIIKNIKCIKRFGLDNNPHLIALWEHLQANPNFEFPPYPSREDWDKCKNSKEERDWYIGLVSIFCSNMAGGFPAGYDKMGLRYNGRIKNCQKDLPLLKDVIFECEDYKNILLNSHNTLLYCDPPYANTHKYNYQKFDSEEFWQWAREQSKNNYVFVSEQEAPEDFTSIWSLDIKHNIRGNTRIATENLFIYENGMVKKYISQTEN